MATDLSKSPHIDIAEESWEPTGEYLNENDPRGRLRTTIQINGVFMHLEAYEVMIGEDQHLCDEDVDTALPRITGDAAFPLTELEILGRRYVLIATPFGE